MSFVIIRPAQINDTWLVSSNVAENDFSAWSSVTAYGLAARTQLTFGAAVTGSFSSLPLAGQAATTGVFNVTAVSAGTLYPGMELSGAPIPRGMKILGNGTGAGGIGTYVVNLQRNISSGAVGASLHKSFESKQAGNLNHYPMGGASDPWWLDLGATNRWRMFDQSINSQTINAGSIDCQFNTAGIVDSVWVGEVDAGTIRFTMTDVNEGVVYDQTYSLVSTEGINDPYSYTFEPIVRKRSFAELDMPRYNNATITVTLASPGGDAKCGVCVLGLRKNIGETLWGITLGIDDYSVKEADAFGQLTILERGYSNEVDLQIEIDSRFVDIVHATLAQYRATAVVYIGSDMFASSGVYGFFDNFKILIPGKNKSICNIKLKGML